MAGRVATGLFIFNAPFARLGGLGLGLLLALGGGLPAWGQAATPPARPDSSLLATAARSLAQRYAAGLGYESGLYNGPLYTDYVRPGTQGHRFFGASAPQPASLTYAGYPYQGVLVRIRKDGFHFLVPDYEARETMENPLVLLDGVPVFDTNRIMAFDPLKVQRLDVVTNHYFLGQARHNGLVSFRTYRGDLAGFALPTHALLQEYEGMQGQREFYAPRYDTPAAAQSRLPDFRNLLYWQPTLLTTPGTSTTATFFTSDQVGRYRVVVQGLTAAGLTGSTSFTFEVQAPL